MQKHLLLLLACLLIAAQQLACAQDPATTEATQSTRGAERKSLRFSRFRVNLTEGESIGEIKYGTFCGGATPLTTNTRTVEAITAPAVRAIREELVRAGYRDAARSQKLFEEESDNKQPDLLLGGSVEAFQTSYCSSGGGSKTDGRVKVRVHWELYDTRSRTIVHSKTTEGEYETNGTEAMREGEFFGQAYRAALRQLLADQKFSDAVVLANAPDTSVKPSAASAAAATKVTLQRIAPLPDALTGNMTMTRAAVVTITQARGSGSGFFVSEDGYVITNSHVVGNDRFVRVTLATGRELVGEVIQRDSGRDVALIKTEGSKFATLAVGTNEINVGAEVVAIGSPLGEALSGTVTRGIVSGYRTFDGRRYIQSDVSILPGNSGGPLLDKSGYVVGITVMGLAGGRLNFFVPIQEALTSLNITMGAQ